MEVVMPISMLLGSLSGKNIPLIGLLGRRLHLSIADLDITSPVLSNLARGLAVHFASLSARFVILP